MSNRPVILFDIMDTLVYNPFNAEIPEFFGLTQQQLIQQKDPTAWPEFERGEIDEPEYLRRYFRDQRRFDHTRFRRHVAAAYRWIDQAERMLITLSRAGFEIHALSNYPIWYRIIENRLMISRYLHWTFVSCLTGIRKPAAAAYRGAAETLRKSPSSFLFIDDCLENCQAAEAIGMPSIHFHGMANLDDQLRQRGYLASSTH